ncbi:hypothetical protein L1279_002033 [Planomicrobium sp. HSC-17F08]|nr:hypothetical protein [Planomicrobium sp. HSC-17F08]
MSFLRACAELTRPGSRVDFGTSLSRGSLRCLLHIKKGQETYRVLDFPTSLHVTSCKEAGEWNEAEGGDFCGKAKPSRPWSRIATKRLGASPRKASACSGIIMIAKISRQFELKKYLFYTLLRSCFAEYRQIYAINS